MKFRPGVVPQCPSNRGLMCSKVGGRSGNGNGRGGAPFGEAAFIVGVVGAGLLAVPVLAGSTAYAVAAIFGWPEGLAGRAAQERGFNLVLASWAAGCSRSGPTSIPPTRSFTARC